jgi:hypothetical protein
MTNLEFRIRPLHINYFVDRLKKNKPFMFVKILHGFWEKIYGLSPNRSFEEIIEDILEFYSKNQITNFDFIKYFPENQNNIQIDILMKRIRKDDIHYADVLKMIRNSRLENFILGVHYKPWPGSQSTLEFNESNAISVMNKVLNSVEVYDGHVLKKSCINGEIIDFWKELHNYHVVVVGLYHLEKINNYFNFKDFNFYGVETRLSIRRENFLIDLNKFHKNLKTKKTKVYLLQLGGSLTAWVGYKSYDFLKDSFFIDMGRSIDLWGDKNTPEQHWINEVNRDILNKKIKENKENKLI